MENLSLPHHALDPASRRERLDALESLKSNPGWGIFTAMMAATEVSLLAKLGDPELNGNATLKIAGAYSQLKLNQKWVDKQIQVLRDQILAAEEQEKQQKAGPKRRK